MWIYDASKTGIWWSDLTNYTLTTVFVFAMELSVSLTIMFDCLPLSLSVSQILVIVFLSSTNITEFYSSSSFGLWKNNLILVNTSWVKAPVVVIVVAAAAACSQCCYIFIGISLAIVSVHRGVTNRSESNACKAVHWRSDLMVKLVIYCLMTWPLSSVTTIMMILMMLMWSRYV